MIRALLWDVDGTLAETERDGHRVAFNRAFEDLDLGWHWDERRYGALLHVTGGRERLLADMAAREDAPAGAAAREALARAIHARKNRHYAELLADAGIGLREGVASLVDECLARGVRQAIVTTTSRANVEALMGRAFGSGWRDTFEVVVGGEDVRAKKPDPEAHALALAALRLSPREAIAIEDSPAGAAAARAAEVPVVVTRSHYFADAPIEGAVAIGPGLHARRGWRPACEDPGDGPVGLRELAHWHARADCVSSFG